MGREQDKERERESPFPMFSFRNFIVLVCTFKLMIYLIIIFCVCCEIMSEVHFFPSFEYSLFLVTFIEKSFNSN